MTHKKMICMFAFAVLLMLALTGCSGKQVETGKVRLCEVTHSVFYAPLYVAFELGYFEEAGLTVELINGGGADKVMTAVLAGQADIGFAGPEACIYTYLEGKENYPKVFGQLTKRDGSFLIGRSREEFTWENLRGKTVIGGRKGGVPEMTLEYVLRKNGLIPGQDVEIDTSVQFNMMAGAFAGDSGDYVTLFEPTATEMEKEGKGFVLTSIGAESGEIPYTAFFAMQNYLHEHTQTVEKFIAALAKAQHWVAEHEPSEVAAVILPQFANSSAEVLTNVVQRYQDIDAWNENLIMKQESFDRLQTVMEQAGELSRHVDYSALVDNTWAEKAR